MSFKTNGQDFDQRYVRYDELGLNLLNFGRLYTTGDNSSGQLGNGTLLQEREFEVVSDQREWKAISAGALGRHNLALNIDNQMFSWGNNNFGQLGDGTITNKSDEALVNLDTDWFDISAGQDNSLAVKQYGTLWNWGRTINPIDGTLESKSTPTQVGTSVEWFKCFAGNGTFQNFAIDKSSKLFAWGNNANGQLGLGDTVTRSVPVQVGLLNNWFEVTSSYHTIALTKQGRLFAWGLNTNGQLGLGDTTSRSSPVQIGALNSWVQVSSGKAHTVALRVDGSLWAWGLNTDGQLGNGSNTSFSSPIQVGSMFDWNFVVCGSDHTLAIKRDGTLWAWGKNDQGQLGIGGTLNQNTPTPIVGRDTWKRVDAGNSHSIGILGF